MTDFTFIRECLIEIIELRPNIFDKKTINDIGNNVFDFQNKISVRKLIVQNLIDYPQGKSITKNDIARIIVLTVLIFDDLILSDEFIEVSEYLSFRSSAYSLLIEQQKDGEAAVLFRKLQDLILRTSQNQWLTEKLRAIEKSNRKEASNKVKVLIAKKMFEEANRINTLYNLIPNYIFNEDIENKEKTFFEWRFLEPVYKLAIDFIVVLFIYGLNLLIIKKYEHGDLISFFAKGNFSIFELLYGLALIFLIFWLFKVLDRQLINNLWNKVSKAFIILLAIVVADIYIISKYNSEFKEYFPKEKDKKVLKGDYNDGKTRVLVTKFSPIEKNSPFNKNYTDINISQLFYKKLLTQTIDESGQIDTTIKIDYYPESYSIEKTEDFHTIYNQMKYDIIICGDYVIEKEKEIKIFTNLYVTDRNLLNAIQKMNCLPRLCSCTLKNTQKSFLQYYNYPLEYYKEVFSRLNINDNLQIKIDLPCGLDFNVERDISPEFSITNTIDKSPIISINYIKLIACFDSFINNINDCNKLINLINEILLWNNDNGTNLSLQQKILNLHMCQLKTFILNRIIVLEFQQKKPTKEIFETWTLKLNYINRSIELLCDINNIDEFYKKSLIYSNNFTNYYSLNDKNCTPSEFSLDSIKSEFNNKLINIKREFIELESSNGYLILNKDSLITIPYKNIYNYLNNMKR